MYFSKVNFRDLQRAARSFTDEYRLHQSIWELMARDVDQKRDFLYRVVSSEVPTIYVLSSSPPNSNHTLFEVQTKDYSPILRAGQGLEFSVRVNPVVAKKVEGVKRSKRHDVVMDEKLTRRNAGLRDLSMNELTELAMTKWMTARSDGLGFEVVVGSLCFAEYTQRIFYKKKASRPISLSTVDISGQLTVTDPSLFGTALQFGIGPAKGLGCGLLLIKPVS